MKSLGNGKKDTKNNQKEVPLKGTSLYHFTFGELVYLIIVLSVLIFILWPIMAVLIKSVYHNGQIDFSYYHQLFTTNKKLLTNSIFISTLSMIISVFLGLCIALYITHSNNKGKIFVLGMLLLTMISPPFISSLAYVMLFGRRGIITYKLLHLSLNPYGWHGIVIMQSIGHASMSALLIIGVLKGINKSFEHASRDLGASSFNTLINIVLPMARPGILVALLISFIKSLSDFGTPIIIGGGYNVLATEAYLNVIGLYNLPRASAMSILLMIPALLAFILYRKIMGNSQFFSDKTVSSSYDEMKLPKWINVFLSIVTWIFVIFMIIIYATILWGAFAKTWGVDFSLSLKHIKALNMRTLSAFVRSIEYAFIAGILGSIIGMLLSYILERKKIFGSKVLDFVVTLPYIIPGTFFGIGYLLAFHNGPLVLTGTAAIIVVNCIYRQLPIGTKAGSAVLSQLNPEIESSAMDLGAKDIYVFKDVVLPNLKPAFLVSFINTFTTTMITIGAIIFLVSPGSKVATVVMFDYIKEGDIGAGAVFANIIIIIVLIVNLSFSWFVLGGKNNINGEKEKQYISSIEGINQSI